MTKGAIWAIVIVVVLVGGGIWWWVAANNNVGTPPMASTTTPNGTSSEPTSTASSTPLPQGDSDQSINEEMTDINTQMNGLSSDTANVNSSMNDQPVQQAE
jgi:cytoskeletal protein RodZ